MLKKKIKLFILPMLIFLFVFIICRREMSATEVNGTTGECEWALKDGVLTISGNGEMGDYVETEDGGNVAPWGKEIITVVIKEGVTSIGDCAFYGCTNLTSVEIPNSVTEIGATAFYDCRSLTEIEIPSGVTSIEEYTFFYCRNLTSIEVSNQTTIIGDYAFYCCQNLTDIEIPSGVTSIGIGAFSYCEKLTNIKIPSGITGIPDYAFQYCRGLTSVEIPSSVTTIGNYAFYSCDNLMDIEIPSGVTSIGHSVFYGCNKLTSIKIPSGVTDIGYQLFANCTNLTDVEIPSGVTRIEDYAFGFCKNLRRIIVPKSVGEIGKYAFSDCGDLVIYGYSDSYAEQYANWNDIPFVTLENPFDDVPEGAYYYEPVLWAYGKEITSGYTPTEFGTNGTCTRGEIVTFLWRAMGSPEPTTTENPFTDVPAGIYYEKAVLWAYETGITSGLTETTFGPDKGCTREQIVTFLWRTMGKEEPTITEHSFADVPAGEYYTKAVLWAYETGITSGLTATMFGTGKTCIRADVVTFLYRTLARD